MYRKREAMYNAPVLKKGIEILRLITGTNELLGVSEISRRLSIVKSTALGILKALEEEGLLAQDPVTKKYVPGSSLFDLSKSVLRSMDLPFAAKPFLDRLAERVDETAILAAWESDRSFRVLEVSEPKKELKITVPVGTRLPLYTAALMKVFLSRMTNDEMARLVRENPLPKYTDHSVTRLEDLLERAGARPPGGLRRGPRRVPQGRAGPGGACPQGGPREDGDLHLRPRRLDGRPAPAGHGRRDEEDRPVDRQEDVADDGRF